MLEEDDISLTRRVRSLLNCGTLDHSLVVITILITGGPFTWTPSLPHKLVITRTNTLHQVLMLYITIQGIVL